MDLKEKLRAALASWGVDAGAGGDASLIRSGALDSVALFNLSLWVEEQTGAPVDPTSFDLMQEWDSVESIVRFVATHSPRTPARSTAATAAPRAIERSVALAVGGVQIVPYSAQYKEQVASLQKNLWSADTARNAAIFEWKYERNPFAGDPLVYLAVLDGKVVAMRGFYGSLWEAEGAPSIEWYCTDDLIVTEAHQSQGLFARFTQAAQADLAARGQRLFLSLSALRITRLESLATGSKSVASMKPVARRHWTVSAADQIGGLSARLPVLWRLTRTTEFGRPAERAFARLDRAAVATAMGLKLRFASEPHAEAMAELVEHIGHDGRIRHVRDARWFAWRFRNPVHEYRFVFAQRDQRLVGYLVLQRGLSEFANRRRVNIADWEAESPEVATALLDAALRAGDFPELVTWQSASGPAQARALERAGFTPTDADQTARGLPCIMVRAVNDAAPESDLRVGKRSLLEATNWDLRMAYTHVV